MSHSLKRFDAVALLVMFLLSLNFFLQAWRGPMDRVLRDDAGNVLIVIAARAQPEFFENDYMLSDPDNGAYYVAGPTLLIPLVAHLFKIDYGSAFFYLLLPITLVQLVGFYILGIVIFQRRSWALFLAALSMLFMFLEQGEYWGLWEVPLSRVFYQSLLPYLLAAAVVWVRRPSRWPLIMIGAGLLVWVYPVSTPPIGFILWVSFLPFVPHGWVWWRKISVLIGLGLLFVAVTSPYYINTLGQGNNLVITYEELYSEVDAFREGWDYQLNLPPALVENDAFLQATFVQFQRLLIQSGLPLFGLIGMGVTFYWVRGEQRDKAVQLAVWLLGLYFITLIVPVLGIFDLLPADVSQLQRALQRGARYLFVPLIVYYVWQFILVKQRRLRPIARAAINVMMVVSLVFLTILNLPFVTVNCLGQGRWYCYDPEQDLTELLHYLRDETPEGSQVLVNEQMLSVRYYAQRPMVFDQRDEFFVRYAEPPRVERFFEINAQYRTASDLADPDDPTSMEASAAAFLEIAQTYGSDYYVDTRPLTETQFAVLLPPNAEIVLKNDSYTLVKMPTDDLVD